MRFINTVTAAISLAIGVSAQWPGCEIFSESSGCSCNSLINYYCGINNCPGFYCAGGNQFTTGQNPGVACACNAQGGPNVQPAMSQICNAGYIDSSTGLPALECATWGG
ncbi:hypothetical protein N431DRAFT_469120 [Stipitochalara longipes BDJ]|nr:hypothetical protein N431DRAFT_469120 [Stipitochalara longipes BDJ]